MYIYIAMWGISYLVHGYHVEETNDLKFILAIDECVKHFGLFIS